MKYIKTLFLSLIFFTFALPVHANFVGSIDSSEPAGWLKGGYGNNARSHAVVPCNFYTDPSLVFRPDCPPNTKYRLETHIQGIDGDVKWYFTDIQIGENKDFTLTYDYQAYTYNGELIIRYKFDDGHYQYQSLNDMPQGVGAMGYTSWVSAIDEFSAPEGATSLTAFFSDKPPQDNICPFPTTANSSTCFTANLGILSIANVVLENGNSNEVINLIPNPSLEMLRKNSKLLEAPKSWFKGGWGNNARKFYYYPREEDGTKVVGVEITDYTNGDAKWYFKNVPVTAGTYTFTDSYVSSVPTELGVMYKTPRGDRYEYLATVPPSPSNVNWATFTKKFVVPSDAASLTIFHSIAQVGRLDLDNYVLTKD